MYTKTIQQVIEETNSSKNGLSDKNAKDKLTLNGPNELIKRGNDSFFKKFIKQLIEPMTIILLVAALISAITATVSNDNSGYVDFGIIMLVVIVNAFLGVFQESKAEKAIESLQINSDTECKVLRDCKLIHLSTKELVVGDIIILEAGDTVPADCRIIESASLKIEEAALTGESLPVEKSTEPLTSKEDISLGDRTNMCYMGSNVVYGRGKAIVVATGMKTEMGKIADVLNEAKDEKTPLQITLLKLSKTLSFLVLGICAIIFSFNLIRGYIQGITLDLSTLLDFFMVAISLAVAAIPEGLAAVVTVVLSIGVTKLSKQNAIIRKLTAVETLGCTQIICSDKTGTLTQNKMTVVKYDTDDNSLLFKGIALCNDSRLQGKKVIGEPTEVALVECALRNAFDKNKLEHEYIRVDELPFDSNRKMMSTLHLTTVNDKNTYIQFTKGAPDVILNNCKYIYKNNKQIRLSEEEKEHILKINKEYANNALRVLCLAIKTFDKQPNSLNEKDLCYIGLVGMTDPVRPEVKAAIEKCKLAGITPVMITGDHKDTAVAIAKELGILDNNKIAITGSELDKISDDDFQQKVKDISVYARVQPEHKTRIVNAWKENEMVVAMTGDGVNDSPSIKSADIGIGMGITGTDVTKNVADVVLADDNFATIVSAVEEGRKIYDNVRKAIQFLLSSNLAEVIVIFLSTVFGFIIFKPVQLLWINLITDSFPALALGFEKGNENIMNLPPRYKNSGIFANGMGIDIIIQSIFISVLTLLGYFIGINSVSGSIEFQHAHGTTMAFLVLSLCETFHSLNMRSRTESIFKIKNTNWYLVGSFCLSLILTFIVVFVPFLNKAFGLITINIKETLIALLLSVCIIPLIELYKLLKKLYKSRKYYIL